MSESVKMDPTPPMLAVDANGYVWRCYDQGWSMAPTNPDNSPIPEPVTFYAPVQPDPDASVRAFLDGAPSRREGP